MQASCAVSGIAPFQILRVLLVERLIESTYLLLYLCNCYSIAQAPNHLVVITVVTRIFGTELDRLPNVGSSQNARRCLCGYSELRGHDADDGEGFLIDANATTNDLRVATQYVCPQRTAYDHWFAATGPIFLRKKDAAHRGHYAKRTKISCRNAQ